MRRWDFSSVFAMSSPFKGCDCHTKHFEGRGEGEITVSRAARPTQRTWVDPAEPLAKRPLFKYCMPIARRLALRIVCRMTAMEEVRTVAGQLVSRGKRTWLVRVFLGRDSEGKRRYHNKTIHGTKKEAQRYLNAVLRDVDAGVFMEPSRETLDSYLDRWLETAVKPRVRERTHDDYAKALKRYVRPKLGTRPLAKLSALDIQSVYNQMLDRGLSAASIRYTHAVLRNALKQAVTWQLIPRNPADLVVLPRQERKEMQHLGPEEAKRFLTAAEDDSLYPLFLLALTTGMRPGEYKALQWKDVNFQNSAITVRRSLNNKREIQETKTAKSRRSIQMIPALTRALAEHKRRQAEDRLASAEESENNDLVFATGEGEPLRHRNLVRRHFKRILERAGLSEDVRLYDLRHSCATLLLASGVNPKIVQEILGHSSPMLTLAVYSHVTPNMQQDAVGALERSLFEETKQSAGHSRER